jgi:hypothetical protein
MLLQVILFDFDCLELVSACEWEIQSKVKKRRDSHKQTAWIDNKERKCSIRRCYAGGVVCRLPTTGCVIRSTPSTTPISRCIPNTSRVHSGGHRPLCLSSCRYGWMRETTHTHSQLCLFAPLTLDLPNKRTKEETEQHELTLSISKSACSSFRHCPKV